MQKILVASAVNVKLSFYKDINCLFKWPKVWQLPFNSENYKIMYAGRNNQGHVLQLDYVKLASSESINQSGFNVRFLILRRRQGRLQHGTQLQKMSTQHLPKMHTMRRKLSFLA